ncbi:hypothetical protein OEZ86_000718 [Tetradesmus obliquus]|nr:hypothetical protein OEZ86_000718 [Tetradesmus obliquus]
MPTPPPGDPTRTDLSPADLTWTVIADEAATMTAVMLDADTPSWGIVWREADRQGNLSVPRCQALKIGDEALYKNLKNGETVQNDQGVAIPAPMVCSEDKPGRSVVLLPACNSADNIGPHAVRADIMIAAAGAAAAYDGGQIGAGLGMCAQQWGVRNLLVTAMPSSGSSSSSSNNSSSTTRRQRSSSSSSSSSEDGSQEKKQQEQSHLLDPAAAAALAAVAQQYTRGVVIPARDDMSIILEENLGELDPPPVDLEAVVAVARTTCLQGEKKAETTNEKSLQRRARRVEVSSSNQHSFSKVSCVFLVCHAHGIQGVAAAAIPAVSYGAVKPWNIKGDVLVLDISSLSYQGNHPMFPPIGDPATCAGYCNKTIGCNAWTFCNSTAGCGTGCEEYVKVNPKLQTTVNGNPTIAADSWYGLAAIKSFGPWGPTAGCKSNCSWSSNGSQFSCKATGKWPQGMCSLKKLANPAKPEYWSTNAGEGWVSGYIVAPAQCGPSISARACQRCITSKAPEPCITCAKSPQLKARLLDTVYGGIYELNPADGCGACYSSAAPEKCAACLYGKQPCAACALQPENPGALAARMDVAACIDCSTKYGANYSTPCVSCAALGAQPANVQKCMGCIARASKVACSDTGYPRTCWNPQNSGSDCASCTTDAKDYETCVSCVARKPYSDSCVSCSFLKDAAKQAKCYNCTKAAGLGGTACYDCLNYLTDAKAVDQCLSCATNTKAPVDGRQWCFGCQNCSSGQENAEAGSQHGAPGGGRGTLQLHPRSDVTGNDLDCGQPRGLPCLLCADVAAVTTKCLANTKCRAFVYNGTCGALKLATQPRVKHPSYTVFIVSSANQTESGITTTVRSGNNDGGFRQRCPQAEGGRHGGREVLGQGGSQQTLGEQEGKPQFIFGRLTKAL